MAHRSVVLSLYGLLPTINDNIINALQKRKNNQTRQDFEPNSLVNLHRLVVMLNRGMQILWVRSGQVALHAN